MPRQPLREIVPSGPTRRELLRRGAAASALLLFGGSGGAIARAAATATDTDASWASALGASLARVPVNHLAPESLDAAIRANWGHIGDDDLASLRALRASLPGTDSTDLATLRLDVIRAAVPGYSGPKFASATGWEVEAATARRAAASSTWQAGDLSAGVIPRTDAQRASFVPPPPTDRDAARRASTVARALDAVDVLLGQLVPVHQPLALGV